MNSLERVLYAWGYACYSIVWIRIVSSAKLVHLYMFSDAKHDSKKFRFKYARFLYVSILHVGGAVRKLGSAISWFVRQYCLVKQRVLELFT